MGNDFSIQIGDWKLEIAVRDDWTQVCIVTSEKPANYHYVRLSPAQAEEMREYLNHALPVRQ